MDWSLAVAALPGIAALIGVVFGYRRGRVQADAAVVRSALSLIEPLEKRIAALESEVAELRRENAELHHGVRILCQQISGLGHEPRWRPRNGP